MASLAVSFQFLLPAATSCRCRTGSSSLLTITTSTAHLSPVVEQNPGSSVVALSCMHMCLQHICEACRISLIDIWRPQVKFVQWLKWSHHGVLRLGSWFMHLSCKTQWTDSASLKLPVVGGGGSWILWRRPFLGQCGATGQGLHWAGTGVVL